MEKGIRFNLGIVSSYWQPEPRLQVHIYDNFEKDLYFSYILMELNVPKDRDCLLEERIVAQDSLIFDRDLLTKIVKNRELSENDIFISDPNLFLKGYKEYISRSKQIPTNRVRVSVEGLECRDMHEVYFSYDFDSVPEKTLYLFESALLGASLDFSRRFFAEKDERERKRVQKIAGLLQKYGYLPNIPKIGE